MYIEIKGANFSNKGAELMLIAIKQGLHNSLDDHRLVIDPRSGDYKQRAELGLYQKLNVPRSLSFIVPFLETLPYINKKFNSLMNRYGLISDSKIDIVFDASGFAYSDQWGPEHSENWAKVYMKWKRQGKKIIMLPQAFGPFTSKRIRNSVRKIIYSADLVYARDEDSFSNIVELTGELPLIKKAPDFTSLVEGRLPDSYQVNNDRVFIIPNYRMIDKTDTETSINYIDTLRCIIELLIKDGYKPELLIHDQGSDYELSKEINSQLKNEIVILQESNPIYIKGILGSSYAVIGSRFHGLVNALSQGVPCMAIGWSHKYEALMNDYNCREFLISASENKSNLQEKLKKLVNDNSRSILIQKLKNSSDYQKESARKMWEEVFETLTKI